MYNPVHMQLPIGPRLGAYEVLPEAFGRDLDRMARFQREADMLASLNHPNIAAIYGVEDRALVMELVEGSTLSGPLPIETALNYAPPDCRSAGSGSREGNHPSRSEADKRHGHA